MKKISFTLLLLVLLFAGAEKSFASHATGADLTYVCTGGNNYRFFFTLYRDCNGIPVNTSYSIAGTSTCGGSVNITVDLDSTHEIIHTCPSIITTCAGTSTYMGIEANYYHGDVVLPSVCNHWTFGISPAICNRNAAINNLSPNGATYCLYVQATLNNSVVQCNNSPAFSNLPVSFLCANQVQFYYEHAYDPDNDSITFQMYTPHSDAVTDVVYDAGLSGTQPVTYTVPDSTQFNSVTGDIRFLANAAQITVVAIRVSDYRNGVLIGSVERDMELIFENCSGVPPNPPTASGINGTPDFAAHICYDSLFSFQFYTNDPDTDSTFIGWDHSIFGGALATIDGVFQTGVFSWHPDTFDIHTSPHTFTVYVIDNSCPALSTSSYTFQIFVDSCHATSGINDRENFIQNFSANYSSQYHSIHFNYKLNEASSTTISLYDVMGREIKNVSIQKSKEADRVLDAHGLAAGVYVLNLKTEDGKSQSLKVIIE